jgi:hypothetical protein
VSSDRYKLDSNSLQYLFLGLQISYIMTTFFFFFGRKKGWLGWLFGGRIIIFGNICLNSPYIDDNNIITIFEN